MQQGRKFDEGEDGLSTWCGAIVHRFIGGEVAMASKVRTKRASENGKDLGYAELGEGPDQISRRGEIARAVRSTRGSVQAGRF